MAYIVTIYSSLSIEIARLVSYPTEVLRHELTRWRCVMIIDLNLYDNKGVFIKLLQSPVM